MIDYFILDYNPDHHHKGNEMLFATINSLYGNRDNSLVANTYLIDQGSNREHKRWLRGLQDRWNFNLISLEKNVGISRGVNFAARLCKTDIMCLVTCDALFTKGLDADAIEKFSDDPNICQVSPLSNRSDVAHQVAQVPEDFGADEVSLPGNPDEVYSCLACELTIRFYDINLFEKIGYMDERWKACFECRDFSLRALGQGLITVVSHGSYAWHYGHSAHITGAMTKAYEDYIPTAIHGGASPELRAMWDAKWPNINLDFVNGDFTQPNDFSWVARQYPDNIFMPYRQQVPY
jgi:hypothetical protein